MGTRGSPVGFRKSPKAQGNLSFPDLDLDATDLGGTLTWEDAAELFLGLLVCIDIHVRVYVQTHKLIHACYIHIHTAYVCTFCMYIQNTNTCVYIYIRVYVHIDQTCINKQIKKEHIYIYIYIYL